MLTFHLTSHKEIIESWKSILYVGLPTAATRLILPISLGIVTRIVSSFGSEAVAGLGIATRIEFFSFIVIFSLAVVLGPFVGQNWGARKYERIKRGISLSKKFSVLWGVGTFIALFLTARPIASIFSNNVKVITPVVLYLRIAPIGYGFFGILVVLVSSLMVLRKTFAAAMLMVFQTFVVYLPLAFIGAHFFGIRGIFGALALSYVISGIISNFVLERALIEVYN